MSLDQRVQDKVTFGQRVQDKVTLDQRAQAKVTSGQRVQDKEIRCKATVLFKKHVCYEEYVKMTPKVCGGPLQRWYKTHLLAKTNVFLLVCFCNVAGRGSMGGGLGGRVPLPPQRVSNHFAQESTDMYTWRCLFVGTIWQRGGTNSKGTATGCASRPAQARCRAEAWGRADGGGWGEGAG